MCRSLTHGAATDVGAHGRPVDRVHHGGHGFRGREPVAVVVAGGDGAPVVEVAEHERHRTEPLHAAARCTWQQPTTTSTTTTSYRQHPGLLWYNLTYFGA